MHNDQVLRGIASFYLQRIRELMPYCPQALTEDETLVIVSPLPGFTLPNGNVLLTEKFIEGMNAYKELWGGPVLHLCEPSDRPSQNLDNTEIAVNAPNFKTVCAPFSDLHFQSCFPRNSLVVASVGEQFNSISQICRSIGIASIYVTEYSLSTRNHQIKETERNTIRRAWKVVRQKQQEIRQRKAITLADAIQCNGLPTYRSYRSIGKRAHLFFDSRTTSEMLASRSEVAERYSRNAAKNKLRLAFSGRLTRIKGVDDLLVVADHLRKILQDRFQLSICGDGDYAEQLNRDIEKLGLAGLVEMKGNLDFKTELVPFLKEEADIFVCCHRQGDPSCTYLETMACGVPIVGYSNEAWAALSEYSNTGIVVKSGNTQLMAEQIARLGGARLNLETEALKSLDFARNHTFEKTFEKRVDHFKKVFVSNSRPVDFN